mgnify:CR=1 FL=1
MPEARIGVIGGTGLYQMDGLQNAEEVLPDTPFGNPSDAILTGVVTKYRNRSGGALIGDQGSHVTYTAYLVSTKNGDILWEATFNEEQIFLMDNLLLLPRYAEHGLIWQKNDQLARSGLKRVLATFPGLLENIGKTP